ncbi:MAG: DUF302 domain-containing protein [Candidatus Zixiibacteriota bacterium]
MSYYFNKTVKMSFEQAMVRVIDELKKEGFGVLTEIDVKETLKKKLGVDFRPYKILGTCNPPFAYQALKAEDKIGLVLPCNVIVQEISEGVVEVAAIDPASAMKGIENPELSRIAEQVREKLSKAVAGV